MKSTCTRRTWILVLLLIAALPVLCAVAGCDRSGGKGTRRQDTIRVSGAWALYPMMVKWSEEFRRLHPEVRVDVSAGGAGKGAADALSGLVDLGMVSRDVKPEEIKQGACFASVVKDAVFPTLNQDNPALAKGLGAKGFRKRDLVDLWIRGKALTWRQIPGVDADGNAQVYTRSDSCGAAETWAQYLEGNRQEDLKGVGVYGDPGLAEAVRKDVHGVGYNNLNYAFDAKTGLPLSGLQILPIDLNENGKIDPEEIFDRKEKALRAVNSGLYPSPPARELYLITKESFKGGVKEFVRWILTDGQKYVQEMGYIQLTHAQAEKGLEALRP
jgi:phosphate transport system substrate-binding protein